MISQESQHLQDIRDIPDDTLHHTLGFLDPTDLAELQHVPGFTRLARAHRRETVCVACYHPYRHCGCRRQSQCVGIAYFLFLLTLAAACLLFPFILPRSNHRTGTDNTNSNSTTRTQT